MLRRHALLTLLFVLGLVTGPVVCLALPLQLDRAPAEAERQPATHGAHEHASGSEESPARPADDCCCAPDASIIAAVVSPVRDDALVGAHPAALLTVLPLHSPSSLSIDAPDAARTPLPNVASPAHATRGPPLA